jgi:predicted DNA-binding transcriptional regulator AlpA
LKLIIPSSKISHGIPVFADAWRCRRCWRSLDRQFRKSRKETHMPADDDRMAHIRAPSAPTAEVKPTLQSLGHSIDEAAKLAGVSRALLYRLWAEGAGPPRRRIGRRVVIPHAGLVAWINDGGAHG